MIFRVEFAESAKRELKKLDKYTQKIILLWLKKNLDGCANPRIKGKPLSANRAGQWRYRIGDYRVIAKIDDGKLIILVIVIGHRREVYNK
ncbi:MAG: type II toxin-antitoxin system RelE/ParE family toxin [Bacilli bacterium]|nr:type II toxin-antitoxin system RelE/ParE family toxin [Bacilli bacterium]